MIINPTKRLFDLQKRFEPEDYMGQISSYQSLVEKMVEVMELYTNRPALKQGSIYKNYGELAANVAETCAACTSFVTKEDRVLILIGNSMEFVVALLSCAFMGCAAIPVDPLSKAEEVNHILDECNPVLALCSQGQALLGESAIRQHGVKLIQVNVEPVLGLRQSLNSLRDGCLSGFVERPLLFHYSSGTSGQPKAAIRSQRNLVAEAVGHIQALRLTPNDRVVGVLPFFHSFALGLCVISVLLSGGCLVIEEKFKPHSLLNSIQKEGITILPATPFMFEILTRMQTDLTSALKSVRLCLAGGGPLPITLQERFKEKYGIQLYQHYGSTETGAIAARLPWDSPTKPNSVGRPLSVVEVQILGEAGEVLTPENVGELWVNSEAMLTSFFNNPDLNEQRFRQGWFNTDDLASIDQDGFLTIVGRKKFVISVGDHKIYPAEIENVLSHHPAVGEVVVKGVLDDLGNQRIRAVIVPSKPITAGELKSYCMSRLTDYKVPSLWEFRTNLPKTSTGKVCLDEI